MSETSKRIDYFNTMVGLIFAQLYENFPVAEALNQAAIAEAMGVAHRLGEIDPPIYELGAFPNGDQFETLFMFALSWLEAEGFVRIERELAAAHLVLTAKALTVMNATPQGVVGGKPIGSRLSEAAKGAGRAASNAAIGDLVGQAIGMAAGLTRGAF